MFYKISKLAAVNKKLTITDCEIIIDYVHSYLSIKKVNKFNKVIQKFLAECNKICIN